MQNLINTAKRYSANNVAPYPLVITRGSGSYVYDYNDKSYIDMAGGIAVASFGHCPPRLVNALHEQSKKLATLPRLFYNEPLIKLLARLCPLMNMDKGLPMNSGAEAVETAIKVARKWAYTIKKVEDNQAEILVCNNSFHGRTITTISLSSVEPYKTHFGPLTPGFKSIPYNDLNALKEALNPNTAALMIEPIQGEAGIIIPNQGYLKACEKLCKANNVLLIVDEIQTGLGRTGQRLALQHDKVDPDIVLLGKPLGGGLLPISLVLAKAAVLDVIQPGDHGSTFGGNPLAAHVALEAINFLEEAQLCKRSAQLGNYLLEQLKSIDSRYIIDVRGKGLFVGIELDTQQIEARQLFERLIENGLLTIISRHKIIRLLPPLTISQQELDEAIAIIKKVLE